MSHAPMTADAPAAPAAGASPARRARAATWRRGLTGVVVFLLLAEALGRLGPSPGRSCR